LKLALMDTCMLFQILMEKFTKYLLRINKAYG
jgi:hypothetical protein